MENLFRTVNALFAFIAPVSDFLWDFPTNFKAYSQIPVLGQFPFAILLLVGVGIHFSIRTRFVQTMNPRKIVRIMLRRQSSGTGISAIASFMLGLAMRAGPGNIVSITGAISVGGPGALFWMWVAAFFGMATAFMESTLAQLFKEKKHDEFVDGLPFYGRRILGDRRGVGTFLSLVFIVYALFNVPPQTFNVFTAMGTIAAVTGEHLARQSTVYYCIAVGLVVACSFIIMGGIRRVTAYTDVLVPIKAALFCLMSLVIIAINLPLIPYFFHEVIVGAFAPHTLFGSAIGTPLAQGVKRGLMSNEAG
ncbi:Sodium/glycine symporter GlyP [Candidatus Burkholderia verschuerenii]|uniref:Sodium/glycine symporter GlyP n=1 Tax=Candidatus Burkholderia verschuerenii TaxID=242163 RepID=A0A0L0M270_9BURK|nr:Sodium/glycine symporter GlyP [Candidatus Burkholderia verschuerenii]